MRRRRDPMKPKPIHVSDEPPGEIPQEALGAQLPTITPGTEFVFKFKSRREMTITLWDRHDAWVIDEMKALGVEVFQVQKHESRREL